MIVRAWKTAAAGLLAPAVLFALAACGDDPLSSGSDGGGGTPLFGDVTCDLPRNLIAAGGPPPDGIPALTNPEMVHTAHDDAAYLRPDDRVLGLVIDGQPRAYPHNIMWWHEIVNDTLGGRSFAVTFCPLTGSGLVFDKASAGWGEIDLGVSGLLFANNLMMYDRATNRLIGPQMSVAGRCGDFRSVEPELIGVTETTWGRWRSMHPNTVVVSERTGWERNYQQYPYGGYDRITDNSLLFPMGIDRSRPAKELVLGIRSGDDDGVGYPFGELARVGDAGVINDEVDGRPVAIFFESGSNAAEGTAVAFDRRVAGRTLTFETTEEGVRDVETGTVWRLTGHAGVGPLQGERLELVENAYVSFWFAWKHFQPRSRIFTAS